MAGMEVTIGGDASGVDRALAKAEAAMARAVKAAQTANARALKQAETQARAESRLMDQMDRSYSRQQKAFAASRGGGDDDSDPVAKAEKSARRSGGTLSMLARIAAGSMALGKGFRFATSSIAEYDKINDQAARGSKALHDAVTQLKIGIGRDLSGSAGETSTMLAGLVSKLESARKATVDWLASGNGIGGNRGIASINASIAMQERQSGLQSQISAAKLIRGEIEQRSSTVGKDDRDRVWIEANLKAAEQLARDYERIEAAKGGMDNATRMDLRGRAQAMADEMVGNAMGDFDTAQTARQVQMNAQSEQMTADLIKRQTDERKMAADAEAAAQRDIARLQLDQAEALGGDRRGIATARSRLEVQDRLAAIENDPTLAAATKAALRDATMAAGGAQLQERLAQLDKPGRATTFSGGTFGAGELVAASFAGGNSNPAAQTAKNTQKAAATLEDISRKLDKSGVPTWQ